MDALSKAYVDGSALGFNYGPLLVEEVDNRKDGLYPKLPEVHICRPGKSKPERQAKSSHPNIIRVA